MKTIPQPTSSWMRPLRSVSALSLASFLTCAAWATDGTWNSNTVSNWSDTTKWTDGVFADGIGSIATLDRTLHSANRTLTIDNTSRTVGEIRAVGDSGTSRTITLAASGATLTLDNNGLAAKVSNAGLGNFTVSAQTQLMGNLELTNNIGAEMNNFFGFSGGISSATAGLKTITTFASATPTLTPNNHRIVISVIGISDGAGQVAIVHNSGANLNLQGVANTFSGGLTINSGMVQVTGAGYGELALGAANGAITFGGGTLRISTTDTTNTSNRLTTLNAGGGTIEAGASTVFINWNGTVVGEGALSKTGVGTLTLSQANTYAGGTFANAGFLATDATGTFGLGDVTVATGASLTLGNATSIADAARLFFSAGATITLSEGIETLETIVLGETSVVASGLYTATQLNTFFGLTGGSEVFFGAGSYNITASTIPEPATYAALAGLAILGLVVVRRRRS